VTVLAREDAYPQSKRQFRRPRVAEIVAGSLRNRILSGELEDGTLLPKQSDLLAEFGVTLPVIRDAFSILETEGLITVRRGNVGGAIVHSPQQSKAAYMLGLVMQSRSVRLKDVGKAIRYLEPACAAACANRPDRLETIAPRLRAIIDESYATIDDAYRHITLALEFHMELVSGCGNPAMSLVVGALKSIWSAHLETNARKTSPPATNAVRDSRMAAIKEHESMYECIVNGDSVGAERVARQHFHEEIQERPQGWQRGLDLDAIINVAVLRDV
jgi:GntR family transcriptional regulator, transcriptional repressor for pyruvate dehydrogenase complex